MCIVIIVNGHPRSGKDTFIKLFRSTLDDKGIPNSTISSIDPVKNVLNYLGVDVSSKNDRDRVLLSTIGDALQRHSMFRTSYCINEINKFSETNANTDSFIFVQIREPELIDAIKRGCDDIHAVKGVITILVNRPNQPQVYATKSDSGVKDYAYDNIVINDKRIDDMLFNINSLDVM